MANIADLNEFINHKNNIIDKHLNNLQYNIYNIDDINIIGDIHGDITVLLDFLKKINLVEWSYLNDIKPEDIIDSDYYYYKLGKENINFNDALNGITNNKYILCHHYKRGEKNYVDKENVKVDNTKDFILYIGENSYYNLFINNIIYDTNYVTYDNSNMYKIKFNINKINKLKNTALVFLGDIVDTHYSPKYKLDIFYIRNHKNQNPYYSIYKGTVTEDMLYNNDVGCFHILFILKDIIDHLDNNNKLIILFGNHELNATILNYKYKNSESYYYYAISQHELNDFTPIINNIETLYKIKNKIRRDYIVNNEGLFNIIVSINKKILVSHNFIYQIPFNNIINLIKSKVINPSNKERINLSNETTVIEILECIFRYLLHKINDIDKLIYDQHQQPTTFNESMLYYLDSLFNVYRLDSQKTDHKKILCNNNMLELNNLNENSCQNNAHIVGHMPQNFAENAREALNTNKELHNIPVDYKSGFARNSILTEYNNFYLYFMDYHLSASFYNIDNIKNDHDKYYYLHIYISKSDINEPTIYREFIQFRDKHNPMKPYIPREYKPDDEIPSNSQIKKKKLNIVKQPSIDIDALPPREQFKKRKIYNL